MVRNYNQEKHQEIQQEIDKIRKLNSEQTIKKIAEIFLIQLSEMNANLSNIAGELQTIKSELHLIKNTMK